jgi:hypothetical protein
MRQELRPKVIEDLVGGFLRDGFCILPGFIERAKIDRWNGAFQPLLSEHLRSQADASFRGANRHYVTLPFTRPFADPTIFDDDTLIAILERVVGKDFVMCQLASDTPTLGSDYQDIHSDAPPLFSEENLSTPSFQLAVNFPLCDVTKENGPLEITRGTHRIPKLEGLAKIESGEIPIESIEMKMGDVMVRDVRCLHRGTPNRTDTPRPMVVIGYSRKWLYRPEVHIDVPRSEFEKLSERAKHMLRFNPLIDELPKTPARETYKAFAY